MSTSKILSAGLVGAIVALLLGFIVYGLLMADFFMENTGSVSGVYRPEDDMLWGPMILGHLSWGLFFSIIYGRWANISTFSSGAKAGAILGFLVGFTYDMIYLGSTYIINLTAAVVDVVFMIVISAIVGGVVAWFLGRNSAAS